MDGWMDGWMRGQMGRLIDIHIDRQVHDSVDIQPDRQMRLPNMYMLFSSACIMHFFMCSFMYTYRYVDIQV